MEEVYNATEMNINQNSNAFTDLKSLELEVPTFCPYGVRFGTQGQTLRYF